MGVCPSVHDGVSLRGVHPEDQGQYLFSPKTGDGGRPCLSLKQSNIISKGPAQCWSPTLGLPSYLPDRATPNNNWCLPYLPLNVLDCSPNVYPPSFPTLQGVKKDAKLRSSLRTLTHGAHCTQSTGFDCPWPLSKRDPSWCFGPHGSLTKAFTHPSPGPPRLSPFDLCHS